MHTETNLKAAYWRGISGMAYRYDVYPLNTSWKHLPGNYIFAKQLLDGSWYAVYVGQTEDLAKRLPSHNKLGLALAYGATHVHAHENRNEMMRYLEESDLIKGNSPPCNLNDG